MQFENRGIVGPDVSFYQADATKGQYINFQKMKDYGVNFVVVRAGQHTWTDVSFRVNWREAKRVGIPRAAYWFLDYRSKGKAQAERFWELLKDDPGEGPLIVDFEVGSGYWQHHLDDFIVRLQELSQYPPDRIWIYTGYYYWKDFGPREPHEKLWFRSYGLWLAAYTDIDRVDRVLVPEPWTTANMWQQGTTTVWGPDLGVLSLELDWNIWNGDIENFKKYWITDYVPTPPEEGGEDMEYKVVWSKGVSRRTAPHTGTAEEPTYTGLIYQYPEIVPVIEDNIPDALDPTNPDKKWVKFADGHFGASNYPDSIGVPRIRMEKVDEVDPTPEPVDPKEPFVLKVEGFKEFRGELERE
jgi:hypothetical protein